jgi:hypothetical protein
VSWKRPTSRSGMHVFTCDNPHYACPTDFRSASVVGVLGEQLRVAGWIVLTGSNETGPGAKSTIVESIQGKQERYFRCPAHRPPPRMG